MDKECTITQECTADFRDEFAVEKLTYFLDKILVDKNYIVLCVGSDKALDDCLGPLCGSFLENKIVLPVIGTLTRPVHASNILFTLDKINLLYPEHSLIVIDAAKSEMYPPGTIVAINKGLELTDSDGICHVIGDASIVGITKNTDSVADIKGVSGLAQISAMSLTAAEALRNVF